MSYRAEVMRRVTAAVLADPPKSDDRRREAQEALLISAAAIIIKRLGVEAPSDLVEAMVDSASDAMRKVVAGRENKG